MNKFSIVQDYAIATEGRVGLGLADYIQRHAGDGRTYLSNITSFCPHEVVTSPNADRTYVPNTNVTILGDEISAPIMIAPTAFHGMFTPQGEAATSAAARMFGTKYAISSFSTLDFHQIDTDLSHTWYQLLMYKDLGLMKRYIDRAVDAGCSAIVLTIDAVVGCSMCKRDPGVPAVEFPVHRLPIFPEDPAVPYSTLDDYYPKYMPGQLNWDDVREIVSYTKVPVVLKGVLTTEEVCKAVKVGAKAVVVSNHGGRQNDMLPATFDALKSLPDCFRDEIDIYLDGGIRDGRDIFYALAFGAKAVLIGRPALWALAVNGRDGLLDVLNILTDSLRECMQEAGCRSLADITPDKVAKIE